MDLSNAKKGKTYLTENISLPQKVAEHLEALGFTKGTKIEVTECKKRGAMVVKVRGTKIALGREFLRGICVREMDS